MGSRSRPAQSAGGGYVNHHYVPQWYQKRFLAPDARENQLHHLDLQPPSVTDGLGRRFELPARRRRSVRQCFVEEDLYSLRFRGVRSPLIEQILFGEIDRRGSTAVGWWADFEHPSLDRPSVSGLLHFMSAQKLRTPKGLDWIARQVGAKDPNVVLQAMVELRTLYTAIWAECVWQLADASASDTKFIVSDHPVTVYNRSCGPRHEFCRGSNDPDIRLHGSHTLFPLGPDRILILTNLSWARNPYQSATRMRPNPDFYRDSVFNIFEVQTHRELAEREVREMNFILKSRAYRYIAAGKAEWLYPEEYVSKSDWATFGNGYLLMPDPRGLHHGGEMYLGYDDGSTEGFDAYGRRPWEPDFGKDEASRGGRDPLLRFQGEFARLFGPERRGRSFQAGRLEDERDSEGFHQYHLDLERRHKR